MREPIFTGSAVAIATPFTNGEIDYETFGKLIDWQIENGTDAIVVCGTTGESAAMTDAERQGSIAYCAERVAGRVKVIAGTGTNDTRHAVALSRFADSVGVDGLLLVTPYYNKTSQAGLVAHFTHIADQVNTPIILYNVPSRTGISIGVDAYAEMAKHPLIRGTKEASGDLSLVVKTMAACGEDFHVWSGNDDQTVPIMSLGGKGIISVAANVIPRQMHEMAQSCLDGDFKKAAALQIRYNELINALFLETNPIPVKAAMEMMGLSSGEVRLPLVEIGAANREKLRAAMEKAELI